MTNKNAGAVSEAELRTSNGAQILGEQENLTPGLSGGFSLTLPPGSYKINCPGASQAHWKFTVTGKSTGAVLAVQPAADGGGAGLRRLRQADHADLVTHTQTFCQAIDAGQHEPGQDALPQARVYYERIEPVAEIWGSLDTRSTAGGRTRSR